ncbi:hypothetical protein DYB32_003283 [Aphanomyces invadans]|uniref:U-box domain-containing protein n=1 Tax=Aphanomyces invadans TaxID=157072 RepID=A0A3R7ABF3_9STRA|nr:hypothetical protein DYB32_003283 [Aphanomyces invadans]
MTGYGFFAGLLDHVTSGKIAKMDNLPTLAAFTCPIGGKRMEDPVVASDGYSYDRRFLEAWLEVQSTSPTTQQPLPSKVLLPNHALKSAIHEVAVHGVSIEIVSFVGPITQDVLVEPVVACDGHTYERTSIQHWFRTRRTSPVTNAVLHNTTLLPNHTLKKAIEEVWPKSSSRTLAPPIVVMSHDTVTCDGCGMHPIVGPRYKSHTAKNFDLCAVCEASGAFVAQEPFFKILDSRILGRPATPIIPPPSSTPHASPTARASMQSDPGPNNMTRHPAYTVCHTSVTCDGCFAFPIRGIRFKSGVAFDFDLCSACEASGQFAFCEPFLKIPDSRKLGRPATIDVHNVDHTGDVLYRLRMSVAVCWTPNHLDVLRTSGVNPLLPVNSLLLGKRRVRGDDGIVYVEVSGRLLGLPAVQAYVPQEIESLGSDNRRPDIGVARERTMDEEVIAQQRRVFVTTRALPLRRWPSNLDSAIGSTQMISAHAEVSTDAVVLNELHQPFYRIAHKNEWVCILDDKDAMLVAS